MMEAGSLPHASLYLASQANTPGAQSQLPLPMAGLAYLPISPSSIKRDNSAYQNRILGVNLMMMTHSDHKTLRSMPGIYVVNLLADGIPQRWPYPSLSHPTG